MPKRLVEFELEDGNTVLMEVDDAGPSGGPTYRSANRTNAVVEKAQVTYEQALDRVRPAAESIVERMRSLGDPPDEVEVQFGLKMSAEFGAFIASANAEVNYVIRLVWRRNSLG
ncbi:MAG TPA: CU044_2847 family protein [Chloroflexia bacterium]|jgi:hypothetical protein